MERERDRERKRERERQREKVKDRESQKQRQIKIKTDRETVGEFSNYRRQGTPPPPEIESVGSGEERRIILFALIPLSSLVST